MFRVEIYFGDFLGCREGEHLGGTVEGAEEAMTEQRLQVAKSEFSGLGESRMSHSHPVMQ